MNIIKTTDFIKEDFEKYEDVIVGIFAICKKHDLYYDYNLINSLVSESKKFILEEYIKCLNSFPQYEGLEFKDSFNNRSKNKLEKTNLDFVNYDIEKIKTNIENAVIRGDVNLHGKWLNSLREALELKDKLENKKPKNDLIRFETDVEIISDSSDYTTIELDLPKEFISIPTENISCVASILKIEELKDNYFPFWSGIYANVKNNKIIIKGISLFKNKNNTDKTYYGKLTAHVTLIAYNPNI